MEKKDSIEDLAQKIIKEIDHWEDMKLHGCNDPFWSDGVNMNLTRNHIIYYKRQIVEKCEESGKELPDECFCQTPPEVSNFFMATLNGKNKGRIDRIVKNALQSGKSVTTKKPSYQRDQISLF